MKTKLLLKSVGAALPLTLLLPSSPASAASDSHTASSCTVSHYYGFTSIGGSHYYSTATSNDPDCSVGVGVYIGTCSPNGGQISGDRTVPIAVTRTATNSNNRYGVIIGADMFCHA